MLLRQSIESSVKIAIVFILVKFRVMPYKRKSKMQMINSNNQITHRTTKIINLMTKSCQIELTINFDNHNNATSSTFIVSN